jgi:hypothetical protein
MTNKSLLKHSGKEAIESNLVKKRKKGHIIKISETKGKKSTQVTSGYNLLYSHYIIYQLFGRFIIELKIFFNRIKQI